jgi:hypothetical protein
LTGLGRATRIAGVTTRAAALLVILGLGLAARLQLATSRPLVYDEYPWIRIADTVSLTPPQLPIHGSDQPPGGAWWASVGRLLLGPSLVGYRLGAVALSLVVVVCGWRIAASAWGGRAGLVAAALLASNEYLLGLAIPATEKCYLGWALLALFLFRRALERPGTRAFVLAGLAFGAALITKYTVALWGPLFAYELVRRRGLRAACAAGPLLCVLAAAAVFAPDVVWHLMAPPGSGPGAGGLAYQAGRLGLGLESAPLSLFLPPLQLRGPHVAVSEYPTMSLGAGLLLLGSALASLWRPGDGEARFLLRLALVPLAFFSFFGSGRAPELWWTDLSVPPLTLLAARLLSRGPWPAAVVGVGINLVGVPALLSARENCYPPDLRNVPHAAMGACQRDQRAFVARFPERDHAALSWLGGLRLPVAEHYVAALQEYAARLAAPLAQADAAAGADGWPEVPEERRPAERRRVEDALSRLRAGP